MTVVPNRITLVTLGVRDVAEATRFYESLGWTKSSDSQESITFIQTSGPILALFGWDDLAHDALVPSEGSGFRGVTLAINLESEAEVDAVYAAWVAAGATELKAPERVSWGGYSSYVGDPDGHVWEFAHSPFWPIGEDGRVQLAD
jgi:uncharacterized protein